MFYYKTAGYIVLSAAILTATACGSSGAKPDAGLAGTANPSSSSSPHLILKNLTIIGMLYEHIINMYQCILLILDS